MTTSGVGAVSTTAQRIDWLRLIRTENIGPASFRRLINRFGSAAAALDALPSLSRRSGGKAVRIATRDEVEDEIARLDALGGASSPCANRTIPTSCATSPGHRRS